MQQVVPSTRNDEMAGRTIHPRDKAVLNLNDMYTTTNMSTHRKFKQGELKDYPEKNVPTYWECEEYPKAWGHGMHEKLVETSDSACFPTKNSSCNYHDFFVVLCRRIRYQERSYPWLTECSSNIEQNTCRGSRRRWFQYLTGEFEYNLTTND